MNSFPTSHYLTTEFLRNRWEKGGREYEVSFWLRPVSAMFESFDAGFDVQTLSEPQPLPKCQERFPDAWKRLTTKPHSLFFKLTRVNQPSTAGI